MHFHGKILKLLFKKVRIEFLLLNKKTREIARIYVFWISHWIIQKSIMEPNPFSKILKEEFYNEDEPQPKLTGYVRLEENSYFER